MISHGAVMTFELVDVATDLNRMTSEVLLGIQAKPKAGFDELRERVLEGVEAEALRREAAERFNLSPNSAMKWWQRWCDTGGAKAKPSGGSTPLPSAEWLLGVATERI